MHIQSELREGLLRKELLKVKNIKLYLEASIRTTQECGMLN